MDSITRRTIHDFIMLYKDNPCLWQVTLKDYRNPLKRDKAYMKLAEKLKEIEPSANKDAVLRKINNLRSNCRKEMKKVLASKKTARSPEDVYEPKLWYFHLFDFLRDAGSRKMTEFGSDRESEDEYDNSNPGDHEVFYLVDQDNAELATLDNDESNDIMDNAGDELELEQKTDYHTTSSLSTEETTSASCKRKMPSTNSLPSNKKPFYEPQIDIVSKDFHSSANILNHKSAPIVRDDSYDCFGKYIASLLRSIGPPHALRLQESITSQVIDAMCSRQS